MIISISALEKIELKIYVDHLTGIICAYGAIGKCVMTTIFFFSPSQEDFFTVCQIQVFVLSCYLIIFYSKLVHIPKLFLATFNVAFFAFVEETCCNFFSTKGHSAECKEQSYNEQGCPYQNLEIHGPRVKG